MERIRSIRSGACRLCGGAGLLLAPLLLVSLLAAGSAHAGDPSRGADAYDAGDARVEAELLVDAGALRPGQTVRVGVLFRMDPGWHVYWRNAGDSGLPTRLDWNFEQAEVGPIRWPAPEVFQESDGFLTTYGYRDEVLLTSLAVVAPRQPGRARVAVTADFVTCRIGCIPGSISLSRVLDVTEKGLPAPESVHSLFARFERRIPRSARSYGLEVEAIHSQSAIRPGDDFRTALVLRCVDPTEGCQGARLAAAAPHEAFVPDEVPGVELEVVGYEREADGLALALAGHAFSDGPQAVSDGPQAVSDGPQAVSDGPEAVVDEPEAVEQRIRGLVPLSLADGRTWVEVDAPLPRAAAGAEVSTFESPLLSLTGGFEPPRPSGSLVYAIGLALLGGLILNLMPCVLPILALKVFRVAELAHQSRRVVAGHGAAYSAGVLSSMLLLAGLVSALRAAGTAVGWGFQFQEPLFVAAICTLLVVFALNLFGVFEVTFQPAGAARLGAEATGLRRSFFEGLLAVVLATPCTAPFLGTAVGFAFASPPPVIFAIFGAIGVGLAAPYAAVTLVPAWSRIVPRPGAWMLRVRTGLGFSLVATVVWLLWVVGRSVGIDAQAVLLAYLVGVGFLAWIFGSVQESGRRGLVAATAAACGAVALLGLAAVPLEPTGRPPAAGVGVGVASADAAVPTSDAPWRAYDPGAVLGELRRGRLVFVDFTADWCITCKVNEKVVFDDERVKQELDRLDVATFKADWTLYDEGIREVLASHGKAGVPMYLLYRPDAPDEPDVLPELLSVGGVIEALRAAAGAGGA